MRSIKDRSDGGRIESRNDITSKYDGMNENELMGALMRNVAAAKSDGTFSERELDEFVAFVSPSLDEASRVRLAELVRMIKGS